MPDFTREFICEQWVGHALIEVFNFFSSERNLEAITPKWLNFHVLKKITEQIHARTEIDYKISLNGHPLRWRTHISDWNPSHQFIDIQFKVPYSFWHHFHQFSEANGGTIIRDHIHYKLPFSIFRHLLGGGFLRKDIERIVSFSQQKIGEIFASPPKIKEEILR